jgi:hypothetical protein
MPEGKSYPAEPLAKFKNDREKCPGIDYEKCQGTT